MRNIKIGSRLFICFSTILVMGVIGHLVGVYQINVLRNQSVQLIDKHNQDIAILKVYKDIMIIQNTLEVGVTGQDIFILEECPTLVENFKKDMLRAQNELSHSEEEKERHRKIINSLIAINDIFPEHVTKISELAHLGDWLAVDLRVKNQIQSFVERLDENVGHIRDEVKMEEANYEKKAQKAEERAFWAIVISAVVIFLLASIMAFVVTKSITVPLEKLDSGARAIANGDFSHRVEIKGGDELFLMANTFNQMTGELAELYANLEQKVSERTRDLEEKNRELTRTQEKLIESEKLNTISQVIVSLSHEINNPLTAAIGNIMLLSMEKDTVNREELGKMLKTTEEELKRIMAVMQKLKTMEKPTTKTYMPGVEMIG